MREWGAINEEGDMARVEHVVTAGETVGGIARRYGVRAADVARWNALASADRIRVGQRLVIERAAVASTSAVNKAVPAEPAWLRVARAEVGVKEVAGPGDAARIVEYHGATSLGAKDDEVAWCAAFVGWCLRRSGHASTGSAAARSYERYGTALAQPRVGAVVVLSRGAQTWQGHVGFVVGWTARYVDVLGGNQSDKVCVQRFERKRVLAWRWPTEEVGR